MNDEMNPEELREHLIEVFSEMPCDLSYDEITEEEPEDSSAAPCAPVTP